MTTFTAADFNAALAERQISAVYSGAHGCACGCKGKHSSTPRSIAAVLRNMRKAIDTGAATAIVVEKNYVCVKTETRMLIAYTDGRTAQ